MKTISFGWQEMKYKVWMQRCHDGGEGTTRDIKIIRDEEMSAHELNELCAFLLLTTFKVLSFSQLKYQQRLYSILQPGEDISIFTIFHDEESS